MLLLNFVTLNIEWVFLFAMIMWQQFFYINFLLLHMS